MAQDESKSPNDIPEPSEEVKHPENRPEEGKQPSDNDLQNDQQMADQRAREKGGPAQQ